VPQADGGAFRAKRHERARRLDGRKVDRRRCGDPVCLLLVTCRPRCARPAYEFADLVKSFVLRRLDGRRPAGTAPG
jgi:hypothetical protein